MSSSYLGVRRAVAVGLVIGLAGCTTLPSHGPSAQAILDNAAQSAPQAAEPLQYELVELDAASAKRHGVLRPAHFSAALRGRTGRYNRDVVAQGDVLTVRIWEAGRDGLFSTAESSSTEITIDVSSDGTIRVPYAGQVTARGRTLEDLRVAILEALSGKVLEPEVQVARLKSDALAVSVLGDVNRPGRVQLPSQNASILDVVALAGGQSNPAWETQASIVRGARREAIRLDTAFKNAADNIAVQPGDTVHLEFAPRYYSAFGAVSRNGELRMEKERVTLAEAIANSGGLRDDLADPSALFLFRFENPATFGKLSPAQRAMLVGERLPVIYRLDLSRPDAFFLAGTFEIGDGDILYAANADASEFRKFVLTFLTPLLTTTNTVNNVTN